MERSWNSLPNAQGLPEGVVQFRSYEQLVKELDPELAADAICW